MTKCYRHWINNFASLFGNFAELKLSNFLKVKTFALTDIFDFTWKAPNKLCRKYTKMLLSRIVLFKKVI